MRQSCREVCQDRCCGKTSDKQPWAEPFRPPGVSSESGREGEALMEKLRRYLGEATLCRVRAETAVDANVREIYLEQAETWDRLADSRQWLVLWQGGAAAR